MPLHRLSFVGLELVRLVQNPIRNTKLANIVQPASELEFFAIDEALVRVELSRHAQSEVVFFAHSDSAAQHGRDLFAMDATGEGGPLPITTTEAYESDARLSPDGSHVAYEADKEIYVVSFPEAGIPQQVSLGGGMSPRWEGAGTELFFWKADSLMSAPVTRVEPLGFGQADFLFVVPEVDVLNQFYDVTSDGQWFLIRTQNPGVASQSIQVVVDWQRESADVGRSRK